MSDEGKLFIGGLSFDTTEDTLAVAFGKYGTIEKVDVIRDRETGRSRGFGFVKYEHVDDAKDALDAMNGKTLDGRAIRVDEAGKGSRSRGGGGYSSGPRGGGRFNSGSRGRGRGFSRGGGYGDRSYGDRSYGDRSFGSGERSFGSSGGYRSGSGGGGYSGGGYRDNRGQGGYGDRSGTYRDGYDSYASHEVSKVTYSFTGFPNTQEGQPVMCYVAEGDLSCFCTTAPGEDLLMDAGIQAGLKN